MADIYESTRDLYQIFGLTRKPVEPTEPEKSWTHGPSNPVQINRTIPGGASIRHPATDIAGMIILGAMLLPFIGSRR